MEAFQKTKQSEPKREHRDARRAVHDAFREMRRRLEDYVRRTRGQTKQHDLEIRAKVTNLFPAMDHGFLEPQDGREVYFHRNSALDRRFDRLRIGSEVQFAEEPGEKGPQVSTVKVTHASRQTRKAAEFAAVATAKPRR